METQSMNIFEFFISMYMLLFFFIAVSILLNYSETIQKKIVEELEKDGMSGSIEHIWHKKYISPLFTKGVGILMSMFAFIVAFASLIADIEEDLNLLISLPLVVFNMFLQHKLLFYFIKANGKIKKGEKKTMLGGIDIAIMFGSIPEKVFWIFLGISYLWHVTAVLKIII